MSTAYLPEDSILGPLEIVNVYMSYDGPRLFSCRSVFDVHFLAVFADEDEVFDRYLFAAADKSRFAEVEAGNISLRDAFTAPSWNQLFVYSVSLDRSTLEQVQPGAVDVDWLPDEDTRLSVLTETQRKLVARDLGDEANSINRTVAAFELDTQFRTTEYSLRPLGEMMQLVQDTVDSFAQMAKDKPTKGGAVQADILDGAELTLRDLRAASFAFVVASAPKDRLFEDPIVPQSLELLLATMEAATSADLETRLASLSPRALAKYRELLEGLEDSETGLTALVANPRETVVETRLDREGVRRSLSLARAKSSNDIQSIAIDAELVGANSRTKSFELYDHAKDRSYRGKAVEDARSQLEGLAIGAMCHAQLLEEQTEHPLTGDVTFSYRLSSIRSSTRSSKTNSKKVPPSDGT